MYQGFKNYYTWAAALELRNDQKLNEEIIKLILRSKDKKEASVRLKYQIENRNIKFLDTNIYININDINFEEVINEFHEDRRVSQYFIHQNSLIYLKEMDENNNPLLAEVDYFNGIENKMRIILDKTKEVKFIKIEDVLNVIY